jgi:uncharacterized protein with von Willebrand factor type A (vWA) domain
MSENLTEKLTGLASQLDRSLNPLGKSDLGFLGKVEAQDTKSDDLEFGPTVDGETPVVYSDTVLRHDLWSKNRGIEILDDTPVLQEMYGCQSLKTDEDKERRRQSELATADFFESLFGLNTEFAENPHDAKREQYMRDLMETEEFQQLRNDTALDEYSSSLATVRISEQWAAIQDKHGEEPGEPGPEGGFGQEAKKALDNAKEDIQDLKDAQRTLGGMGSGDTSRLGIKEVERIYKKIKNSKQLSEICRLAGRYQNLAASQQRTKTPDGCEDVVGVTRTGDISQVLPQEIAFLGEDDLLELECLRRISESQAFAREHIGYEEEGKGPIVVVCDESGSMYGDPIANAKALALALYWIAKSTKRYVCLVGFSGGREGTYLAIPPDANKPDDLLDWLDHFYGGGTTCDVPLKELPARWDSLGCPAGKTDIILITDAYIKVPTEVEAEFNTWKAAKEVKMTTLVLSQKDHGYGYRGENGYRDSLNAVSNKVHHITNLSVESDAVADVLKV